MKSIRRSVFRVAATLLCACSPAVQVGRLVPLDVSPSLDSLANLANVEGQPPLVLGDRVYLATCPCLTETCTRLRGGSVELRALAGSAEQRSLGGAAEKRIAGGNSEARLSAGQSEQRMGAGAIEARAGGGASEVRSLAAADEARLHGGGAENRSLAGKAESREKGAEGENRDRGGLAESLTCRIVRGEREYHVDAVGNLSLRFFDGKRLVDAVGGKIPF